MDYTTTYYGFNHSSVRQSYCFWVKKNDASKTISLTKKTFTRYGDKLTDWGGMNFRVWKTFRSRSVLKAAVLGSNCSLDSEIYSQKQVVILPFWLMVLTPVWVVTNRASKHPVLSFENGIFVSVFLIFFLFPSCLLPTFN